MKNYLPVVSAAIACLIQIKHVVALVAVAVERRAQRGRWEQFVACTPAQRRDIIALEEVRARATHPRQDTAADP